METIPLKFAPYVLALLIFLYSFFLLKEYKPIYETAIWNEEQFRKAIQTEKESIIYIRKSIVITDNIYFPPNVSLTLSCEWSPCFIIEGEEKVEGIYMGTSKK